ncbi:hypothetical protein C8N26_0283 [Tenacibaculum lutimaris]|uniref:DUF4836 family protein n=1 Tax=Tenacibaculum lutimaris TaxID=285258 RepID=A0A420E4F0_9FLAO|nr:hypothetical protein [Tenacibaculum lutimaris]RKF04889.1 hypothetical protein C8N26_0283 [Tenacibaculum lutimaris]
MIKKIAYTFLIVCCIIVTVGFFRYNPTVIYAEKVPVSAETVIYINLREIEYNILTSFLKYPFSQLDFKKQSAAKKEEQRSLLDEIEIPSSVFLYTNQQEFKGFLISSKISVKNNFAEVLKEKGFKEEKSDGVIIYDKQQITCVVSDKEAQVIYKVNKNDKVSHELIKALNKRDYFSEDAEIFAKSKKHKSPITFTTAKGDFFKVLVDKGQLNIDGQLNEANDIFLPFKTGFDTNGIAIISGKLNTKKLTKILPENTSEKFRKFTTLSLDSIAAKWNGTMDFQLSSFVEKSDTIITYEYDDDFNKVAKKEIQNSITPNIIFNLEGEGLCEYLYKKEVIKQVGGNEVLTLIPLFTTYSFCDKDKLQISSQKQPVLNEMKKLEDKFYFSFNVAQYQAKDRGIYSFKNKYLDKVEVLQLSVANNNQLKGTIKLNNTSKNFFLQVLN